MELHVVPAFRALDAAVAACIGVAFIGIMSFVREPIRHRLNAIILAGAGAAYLSGGLEGWEFLFCSVMTYVAYRGLDTYWYIGVGWLLHTVWDIVHHLYAQPIVPFSPGSSAGCAVCDSILALWFFFGAPSLRPGASLSARGS